MMPYIFHAKSFLFPSRHFGKNFAKTVRPAKFDQIFKPSNIPTRMEHELIDFYFDFFFIQTWCFYSAHTIKTKLRFFFDLP